jgi:hypothetical protein
VIELSHNERGVSNLQKYIKNRGKERLSCLQPDATHRVAHDKDVFAEVEVFKQGDCVVGEVLDRVGDTLGGVRVTRVRTCRRL